MSHNLASPQTPALRRTAFQNVCLLLLGLALPLSTALVTAVLAILFIGIAVQYRQIPWRAVVREPLVYLALLLFAALAVSLIWSTGGAPEDYLSKYRKLLYVLPLAACFVCSPASIRYFITGFLIASGVALAVSLYCYLSGDALGYGTPGNAAVIKKDITHNFFMAMAAIGVLVLLRHTPLRLARVGLALWFLLMVANIYLMVEGRTGQVTLLVALLVWVIFDSYTRNRYGKSLYMAIPLFFVALAAVLSFQQSYALGLQEIRQCYLAWQEGLPVMENCYSSMGARASFIFTAFDIVAKHPMGIGIGGFPEQVLDKFHNPHNDYILYLLQLGWAGLLVYLVWLGRALVLAYHEVAQRGILLALLTMYLVGNLFNSFSLDFNEGHLLMILLAYTGALGIRRKILAA